MEKLLKKIIAHNSGSALVTIKIEDKASEEAKLKSLKERGDLVRYSTLGDNHWLCTLNKQIASKTEKQHTKNKIDFYTIQDKIGIFLAIAAVSLFVLCFVNLFSDNLLTGLIFCALGIIVTVVSLTFFFSNSVMEVVWRTLATVGILIVVGIFLLLLLIGGSRSNEQKWEDSYKGVYEEYAEYYGWP